MQTEKIFAAAEALILFRGCRRELSIIPVVFLKLRCNFHSRFIGPNRDYYNLAVIVNEKI